MEKTMIWTSKNGNELKLVAEYEEKMAEEISYADGDHISLGMKPYADARLTVYVDGKSIECVIDPEMWNLRETESNGLAIMEICGTRLAFAKDDTEHIAEFEKMISEVIEGGRNNEVQEAIEAEKMTKLNSEIEEAKETVKVAEAQENIPTDAEARKMERQYNDFYNEGGEGFVPHIVGQTEYKQAIAKIEENAR